MARRIAGVVLFLLGGVWFLQGIGVHIGDSFMIGETLWVIIGAVVAVVGLVLLLVPRRARRTGSTP